MEKEVRAESPIKSISNSWITDIDAWYEHILALDEKTGVIELRGTLNIASQHLFVVLSFMNLQKNRYILLNLVIVQ